MKRRSLISIASGLILEVAPAAWPQSNRMKRIGGLTNLPNQDPVDPYWFRHCLERLGWEYGRTFDYEWRYALNEPRNYQAFAQEFVKARVDLIFALGDDALEVAFAATT